ncbi:hypothetical protein E3N88_20169 [Mikania micrantha]|uniref:Reverse transcriptase Ty1/copia-type domain-containing protein n=1 Tax=Mikania micrantha TaxID=192012 RepID=A0A5N6NG87_9ASTR|nr:hypothetical protein E3N88_20169 [Mikania micrantha]
MLVYVDDTILTGNDQQTIDRVVHNLSNTFALQDMGSLSYFLGIVIVHKGDSPPFDDPVKFRQIVGALQYGTLSRPNLAFAVNKVCQFMHSSTENHWSAVKRILCYGLWLHHDSGSALHAYTDAYLRAFSDADWAGCPDDRRSTGGFAIYLGNNLISWAARKQKTVSWSSTEAEYKALADTVAELTWLETLL